ncbi:efflux RND transporter periplasmic adaptor subunit [Paracoccus albus]|uniref:efflux RND transporter periplasmic adaptor subunit n=1 Tax=Paracoccus albus TaxID=3017784 RepID=UPI0022EFDA7A|nr:efflux RND transporter periplasmic adaptor subunit [Paracoccus albus]WBU59309.1 efflux RND transporter periplasmic adaptor subunit [Paracoccus albus]
MTDQTTGRSPLRFETDKGASRSFWVAMLLLLLIVGWMASGFIIKPDAPQAEAPPEIEPPTVLVRSSAAEEVTLNFRAEGQAQPDRDTSVRAEASGTVIELAVSKGSEVEAGAVIARLSAEQAEADLERARQELSRAQREFDNASQLRERGVATTDRVTQASADLATAQAAVTTAENALEDLSVTAPFAGRVEALPINDGEFVAAGDEVARIVDNTPLTVSIQVPQQSLNRIKVGQVAKVQFITGQEREGEVTFVGTAAEDSTRTFLAEIEIENPDGEIPAGISAEITIPTGQELAHFIEPSIVSLSPDGDVGVKIEEEGVVRFVPVEVADAQMGGIWATGLPENVRIITVGQGFVRDGEEVRVKDEEAEPELAEDAKATPDTSGEDTSAISAADSPGSSELTQNVGPGR